MPDDGKAIGHMYIFNGPSNLKELERVNLAGARLIFNGPFKMQDLRGINFQDTSVILNNQEIDKADLIAFNNRPQSSPFYSTNLSLDSSGNFFAHSDSYTKLPTDSYRPSHGLLALRSTASQSSIHRSAQAKIKNLKIQALAVTEGVNGPEVGERLILREKEKHEGRLSLVSFSGALEEGEIRIPSASDRQLFHPSRLGMLSTSSIKRKASPEHLQRGKKQRKELRDSSGLLPDRTLILGEEHNLRIRNAFLGDSNSRKEASGRQDGQSTDLSDEIGRLSPISSSPEVDREQVAEVDRFLDSLGAINPPSNILEHVASAEEAVARRAQIQSRHCVAAEGLGRERPVSRAICKDVVEGIESADKARPKLENHQVGAELYIIRINASDKPEGDTSSNANEERNGGADCYMPLSIAVAPDPQEHIKEK